MGMLDVNLQFSNAQAITADAASTGFYDQLTGTMGTTTFSLTPNAIWGKATYFGEDLGIGKGLGTPRVVVNTGTVFATIVDLTIKFQGAPNNVTAAASGNRSDLTFVTYMATRAIPVAALTANTRIASFDWPMRSTPNTLALPRFVELYYDVNTSATTGTVTADVTLGDDDAQGTLQRTSNNYTVAA